MKKTVLICLRYLSLFLLLISVSCEKSQPQNNVELVAQLTQLVEANQRFLQLVETANNSSKEFQAQFKKNRLLYKKVEWAVEYFAPDTARFINGPALDELEVEENKFLPPNGFQVIEELIFPQYLPENRKALIAELKILNGNLLQLKRQFEQIPITKEQLFDAHQLNVNRLIALGITGFDSPIAQHSIPEVAATLESFLVLKQQFDSPTFTALEKKVRASQNYCRAHNDFNSFDRAEFILRFVQPIGVLLQQLKTEHRIADVDRNAAVNQSVASFLAANAFNVDAFIPDLQNKYSEAKAKLGEALFSDTDLAGSGNRNCASCHRPERAFTDGLKTNVSLHGKSLPRNTPTLTYAALQNAQFWDLRQSDLEKQSKDVITNKDEMHGDLAVFSKKVNASKKYAKLIKAAFPKEEQLDPTKVQMALASYVRSLTAFNSAFDRYFQGETTAMNAEERAGFNVFAGKAKCATCHFIPVFNGTVPPVFAKTEQEVIGTPATADNKQLSPDLGRYAIHQLPQLRNAFKTPTLRNVAKTAPYMHNGVYNSLEQVVDFYNRGGGVGVGLKVDNQTLPPDALNLTTQEQKQLVAFLKTLNDQ
ncbi:cytochrome c peroxidase [Flavobacterium aurantiibacter]|uniref:Cytochrome-c peroxidase n=1 Tax=Flavobacterium aurantiibacter TaxID=2023067 RepID=A0A255ZPI0_9FLAO|nr:cytochrome c peroxidase [Flavobacterium aurantiibacter]OYQ42795.1 cytochrome-c peroxidase [Flavobacterium aurantiibacter]